MKSKRFFWVLLGLLIVGSLILSACGGKTTEEPIVEPEEDKFLACQVTDVGGIDDKSFNATAWKGFQDAVADFGIEAKYLESQQQTDYEANLNAFLESECDIIVSVGFLLGDAPLQPRKPIRISCMASWMLTTCNPLTSTAAALPSTSPPS